MFPDHESYLDYLELIEIFDQAAVGIVYTDISGFHILRSNRAICRMLGYTQLELGKLSEKDLVYREDLSISQMLHRELLAGRRRSFIAELRFVCKRGSIVWGRVSAAVVRDEEGGIRHLVKLVEDITDAKHTERQLLDMQTRLELAARIGQIGFWEWNLKTNTVYFSPEWKRQLGYEEHEIGNHHREFESRLHPDDLIRVNEQISRFIDHPWHDYSIEFRLRHRDGSYRWIWTRAQGVLNDEGKVCKILGTHIDITERREIEDKMRHMAQHDALTGLPNRSLIYEFAHQYIAAAKRGDHRIAVVFFDLDRFKHINDTYGHEAGDKILIEVANRLRKNVREGDIVGRLGGDEFMAMLNIRNETDIGSAVQHLLENLQKPYTFDDIVLNMSPSIGVAIYPKDGMDINTLIRHADAAMYHAKGNGCNRIKFFDP